MSYINCRKSCYVHSEKRCKRCSRITRVCAGQEAGSEAVLHAIYDVYQQDETEAVLLVDLDNTFNSINRKAMFHIISITCPLITTFIANCYMEPARLFFVGNHEIKSRGRYNTRRPNSNGSLCTRHHSFNSFSKRIHFYQRTQKQRSSICGRFYSCRKSKQD